MRWRDRWKEIPDTKVHREIVDIDGPDIYVKEERIIRYRRGSLAQESNDSNDEDKENTGIDTFSADDPVVIEESIPEESEPDDEAESAGELVDRDEEEETE